MKPDKTSVVSGTSNTIHCGRIVTTSVTFFLGTFSFSKPQATYCNDILSAFLVTALWELFLPLRKKETAEHRPSILNVLFCVQSVIVRDDLTWPKVETYKYLPSFLMPTSILL
jgi:hypothetical protein